MRELFKRFYYLKLYNISWASFLKDSLEDHMLTDHGFFLNVWNSQSWTQHCYWGSWIITKEKAKQGSFVSHVSSPGPAEAGTSSSCPWGHLLRVPGTVLEKLYSV